MTFENEYDLCVIGSGPAGIITALEFEKLNPRKTILIVEYGAAAYSKEKNSLDDSIRLISKQNHHDPYECTNKGLGGTSATWGGRCVMYDEIDFLEREIVGEDCTWDLNILEQVRPYLQKSSEYFECGSAEFNLSGIAKFKNERIADGFVEGFVTDSNVERWSMPTRFGKRYEKRLNTSSRITLLKGFEFRNFSSLDESGTVKTISVRNVVNGELKILQAKDYVLSAGAQETTRILLRNKQLFKNLDEEPKALGRYYQGHLSGKIASVKFQGDPQKTNYGFLLDDDNTYIRQRFQFTNEYLLKNNLLNTAIWLDNPLYFDPSHGSGPMSFMYLAMITPFLGPKLAPPAIAESITKGKIVGVQKHIWNVIKGFPHSLTIPATIFYKRYLLKRKLPGVFLFSPDNRYALHFHSEQTPQFQNQMFLESDGEGLVINYSLTDDDINSVIKVHKALDEWLRHCNCGQLEYWFPEDKLPEAIRAMSKDGIHQSGTTRMSDSPASGVVDRNLKIWGTTNVYVCSSSVFPTSGQANPTYMLGAFACRLSNYLTSQNEKDRIN